jgi:hypothetical protein
MEFLIGVIFGVIGTILYRRFRKKSTSSNQFGSGGVSGGGSERVEDPAEYDKDGESTN